MLSPTGTAQEQLNGQFHNQNNAQLTRCLAHLVLTIW